HDGFMIATPEYNSSVSGVLKNAIDWASRPAPGEKKLECFEGKIAILMSASPGYFGAVRGVLAVRAILTHIGTIVLPHQVNVSHADQAFDAAGELKDLKLRAHVEGLGRELTEFIAKLKH